MTLEAESRLSRNDPRKIHCREGEESSFIVTVSRNVGNLSALPFFDKLERLGLQEFTIDFGIKPTIRWAPRHTLRLPVAVSASRRRDAYSFDPGRDW